MPFGKWTDFENCVRDFISQGKDEETAERICGYLQARLGEESFSWVGNVKPHEKNLIQGTALHPIKTVHPEEWPSVRVYLEEELEKAAYTLIGTPLLLNHLYPIDGRVLSAEYEDGAIEYVAELNDEHILNSIRDGKIKHCSVEYDWRSLDKVNGLAPRGIQFVGLALLKDFEPGDPATSVEIWNRVLERLKEAERLRPPNLGEQKGSEEVKKLNFEEAVWTRSRIDDLPDSAFAIILPGGKKEDGKTAPRSLRKFPHHRADGSLDLPHLRNANARLPQSDLSAAQKAGAGAHLNKHKKQAGIGAAGEEEMIKKWTEHAGEVPQGEIGEVPEVPEQLEVSREPTVDEVIQAVEEALEEVNDAIDQINAKFRALQRKPTLQEQQKAKVIKHLGEALIEPQKQEDFKEAILKELKAAVFERVPQHWGYGAYEQNRRMKELIKKLEG